MLLACSLCVGGLWAPYSPWCLACGSVWAVCASCIGHGCPVGCVLVACGPGSGRGLRVGYVLAGWWLALDCMWALRGGGLLPMLWDSCTACASLPVGRVWTDTGFAHGLHVLCWRHVCWCCCGSWHDTRRVAGVSLCVAGVSLCVAGVSLCVAGVSTCGGHVPPRARAGRVPLPVSCSRQPGAGCARPSGCARPGRERQRAPAGTRERVLHLSRHSARPADPDRLGAGPGRRWGGSRVTIRSPPGLGPPNITVWDNEGPVAAPPPGGPPPAGAPGAGGWGTQPALLPAPPRCPCPPHCPSPPGLSAAALLAILGCGTSLLALAGLLARGRPKGGGAGSAGGGGRGARKHQQLRGARPTPRPSTWLPCSVHPPRTPPWPPRPPCRPPGTGRRRPPGPPHDSLQVYGYDGGDTSCGSLSPLGSSWGAARGRGVTLVSGGPSFALWPSSMGAKRGPPEATPTSQPLLRGHAPPSWSC
ncbi:unnamed protein product [Lepidochelys olivacea]